MVTAVLLEQDPDSLQGRLSRTEQALERAEHLALAGRVAASVMHEINGPLEVVTNLAYLLHTEPLTVEARGYVTLMEEQLCRLHEIAHQTLGFYRATQAMQTTDLVDLVGVALRVYQRGIAEKRLTVTLDLPVIALCAVYPAEITQAFSNLISNAIDASTEGGRLFIRLRVCATRVRILICDSGSGIPLHLRASLFDAFATGKSSGHGLGLWICRRAVEKHGGRIALRTSSVPGRSGTIFRISLGSQPVATPPSQVN